MREDLSAVIRYDIGACGPHLPGLLLVAERGQGVCAILMGDDEDGLRAELRLHFPQGYLHHDPAEMAAPLAAVQDMLADPQGGLDWPLEVAQGTPFQQQVWQALRQIPVGQTVSYAELAQRIGQPRAARAVALACAANPLAVAVPCHRVVRSDGGLSGYRWGEARKQRLLEREVRH
ncbi:MAG: methylated-DNA--[protein]-cysteine S-methyltransferase [Proteobacteria bacterium]|nr:methylated-DNA--[protein]-cysteine S-methyltransferase [Pseudomonadota bacterium]